jgi:hypothetical protein
MVAPLLVMAHDCASRTACLGWHGLPLASPPAPFLRIKRPHDRKISRILFLNKVDKADAAIQYWSY